MQTACYSQPKMQGDTTGDITGEKAIYDVFALRVQQTPDAIAIDGSHGARTYSELAKRAVAIDASLRKAGVRRGDIVACALQRDTEMVASLLAILRVGAAYCTLDLHDPPARHVWTLDDCRPRLLLTTAPLASTLPQHPVDRLYLENISESQEFPPEIVSRDDAACVMYTSGSTGKPKAALIPHRGIIRLFKNDLGIPFGPSMRMLAHSPLHFDATTFEIWGALLHGGTTVLFSGGAVPTIHELQNDLTRHAVNTLFLGPALFNLIIDDAPQTFSGIRTMLVGGDALSVAHICKAQALLPQLNLINGYGPTECTTFATMYSIPRPFPAESSSVPIGVPISATTCHVLDEDLKPVEDGVEGELYIGGDGVALGYLNRPELTAAAFISAPTGSTLHALIADKLIYRTGDRCKRLLDGNLEFRGRADDQVKIHGRRIELGEIEAAVRQHADILDCVVHLQSAGIERNILCYYIERDCRSQINERALRDFLENQLPSYLLPRDYIRIQEIPRKPNGKVDRDALPTAPRHPTSQQLKGDYSSTEKLSVDLWQQTLDDPAADIDTCFFKAGGSSLSAVRLCCAIERSTGRFINISTLLSKSTPRKLASWLDNVAGRETSPIVRLNDTTDQPNLFCFSGHIWNPITFRNIAQHLNGDVSAVTVSLPGFDSAGELLRDTRATAEFALRQVLQHQPGGPYYLIGYSYGGVIAFEIAQQLQAMGESIGALILLDSQMSVHSLHKSRLQRAAVHLRQLSRGGPRLFLKRVKDRQQRIRFEQNQAAHVDRATQVTLQAHAFCEEAFTRYVATPYDGDVLYLQAGKQPEWMAFTNETATGGWPAFVKGKLQVQTIDADHHSMLNPEYAAEIATAVKTYLQVGRSSVKDVNRRVCQSGPIRSSEPELIMASRENRTASTL